MYSEIAVVKKILLLPSRLIFLFNPSPGVCKPATDLQGKDRDALRYFWAFLHFFDANIPVAKIV